MPNALFKNGAITRTIGVRQAGLLWLVSALALPRLVSAAGDESSTLDCIGVRSGTSSVRVLEEVVCTIIITSVGAPTTGSAADFATPTSVGGTGISILQLSADELQVNFTLTSPGVVGANFSVLVTLADGITPLAQGPFDLNVVGTPTTASRISCAGAVSGSAHVRNLELVLCTITVRDANGPTTGVPTDFAVPQTQGGSSLSSILPGASDGSTMLFNITAPATAGSTFHITGRLAAGALFTQTFSLTVVGTPSTASTLSCVGRITGSNFRVRALEIVDCSITARSADGTTTTAFAGDFDNATVTGGELNSLIKVTNGALSGSTMSFSLIASDAVGTEVQITGRLEGQDFTQNAVSFLVVGTPTNQSVISCLGDETAATTVRTEEQVTCSIQFRDTFGTTTGVLADLAFPVVTGGLEISVFTVVNDSYITFTLRAPATVDATFTVQGKLSLGAFPFLNEVKLNVRGRPTSASTLSCRGDVSGSTTLVRASEVVTCNITVKDASGTTKGLATDFTKATSVGGQDISDTFTEENDGANMIFTLRAPGTPGASFQITGLLAGGIPFQQAAISFSVLGTATNQSQLTCVGLVTKSSSVRANETVVCTIQVRKADGTSTTALSSDFGSPIVVGGENVSPYSSLQNGAQIRFTLLAPLTVGMVFTVAGRLSNGNPLVLGAFQLTVVGRATNASTLSCLGDVSGLTTVKTSEIVTCRIVIADDNGPTTALLLDLAIPISVGGTGISSFTQPGNGSEFTFTLGAPSLVDATFSVTGRLAVPAVTLNTVALTVLGRPTVDSLVECRGADTNFTTAVRVGETVLCTIIVKDGPGDTQLTKAVPGDFDVPLVVGGLYLSSIASVLRGSQMTFNLSAPDSAGAVLRVNGRLNGGSLFLQGPITLQVIGQPSNKSTVSCEGSSTLSSVVRTDETVVCEYTARNAAGQITTAFLFDFNEPLTNGGTNVGALQLLGAGTTFRVTLKAPPVVGVTFTVTGRLADNTTFAQGAFALSVVGTPTNDSTLSCAGDISDTTSVQVEEVVTCIIIVRDGSGVTRGIASDYGPQSSVGGRSIDVVKFVAPGDTMTFTLRAPLSTLSTFTITGVMADNSFFKQGAFTMRMIGTPTTASTISCVGARSGTATLRVSEVALCIIQVNDQNGATTGTAIMFAKPLTTGGVAVTEVVEANSAGSEMAVNVTAPGTVGALFTVLGRLSKDLATFSEGFFTLTVVGTPTNASLLACKGSRSQNLFVRVREQVDCVITVRDDVGLTTGVAADFASPTVVGGINPVPGSGVAFVTGGNSMGFSVDAPANVSAPFTITARLADLTDITGALSLTVVGTPTNASTLLCVGIRSGTSLVRVQEVVLCTITVQDDTTTTTGVAADFKSAKVIGGQNVQPTDGVERVGDGSTMLFNMTAPAMVGANFLVTGVTTEQGDFSQGALVLTVVGTPTVASTMACVGTRSGTTTIRVSEQVTCTIIVNDATGLTTGVDRDFGVALTVGGSALNPATGVNSTDNGSAMVFTLSGPGTVGANFSVTGRLADNSTLNTVDLVVAGTPTSNSSVECLGVRSGTTSVRINELVQCIITVLDFNGLTNGVETDFGDPLVVGGRDLDPSEGVTLVSGGATMSFTVVSPGTVGSTFQVTARLADNTTLQPGPLQLTVVGTPTVASTLVCIGARSRTSYVRVEEAVNCTITVRNDISTTTGVASDFGTALYVGGAQLLPSQGVEFLGNGEEMFFSALAPATVGAVFNITGQLANNASFAQAAFPLTVVGTPTNASFLVCIGSRSRTSFVRANETVECTIFVADDTGNTTGVVADFTSPLVASGENSFQDGIIISRASGGSQMRFALTAPADVDATFTVLGRLADGEYFTQGLFLLTVVGTPTVASSLSCVGSTSQVDTIVRTSETVICTITVRDNSGPTTGVAADFCTPLIFGGRNQVPSTGVSYVTGGQTMSFTVIAPSQTGENFNVTGCLNDGGELFSEGALILTVAQFPSVVSWALDLNSASGAQMNITFLVSVNTTFADVTQFVIQGGPENTAPAYRLTDASEFLDSDSEALTKTIVLSTNDTDLLKLKDTLGTDVATAYLRVDEGNGVTDLMISTDVLQPLVLQASIVIADTTAPGLLSGGAGFVSFNLQTTTFTLGFSEPVDTSSLNVSAIGFAPEFSSHSSAIIRLTDSFTTSPPGRTIEVTLGPTDRERMKLDDRVCHSSSVQCWLVMDRSFIKDMAGNEVQPVTHNSFSVDRLPSALVPDQEGPTLLSYELDMAAGEVILTFDEPVDTDVLSSSKVTFQANANKTTLPSTHYHTLSGLGSTSSPRGSVITMVIHHTDLNAIKTGLLADNVNNTFISLTPGLLRDTSQAQLASQALSAETGLQASAFVTDNVAPTLVAFTLNLALNSLTMTFNEPMLVANANVSALVLSANATGTGTVHRLFGGTLTGNRGIVVTLAFSDQDILALKTDSSIAADSGNTFISMESFTTDIAGNFNAHVPSFDGKQATVHVSDTQRPKLLSFSLNMNAGELALTFDDVIDASTLDVSAITIQRQANSASPSRYALTNSGSSSVNSKLIIIALSVTDLNTLKTKTDLATARSTTYLTITAAALNDLTGQDVEPINNGNGLQVSVFTPDSTAGNLTAFSLDLTEHIMRLTFSEAVNGSSIDVTKLTVCNSDLSANVSLSGGMVTQTTLTQFAVALTVNDQDRLKAELTLAVDINSTFALLEARLAIDFVQLPTLAIKSPLQATAYIRDLIAPVFIGFDLNFATNQITLSFSEVVRFDTANMSLFTLQNKQSASQEHTFQGGAVISTALGRTVAIQLEVDDINSIKANANLATDASTTFLRVMAGAVLDASEIPLVAVTDSNAITVTTFTVDNVAPLLVSFGLNLDTGVLSLTFSKPLNGSSFDATGLTLTSNQSGGGENVTLSSETVAPTLITSKTIALLQLTQGDLNKIKLSLQLALDVNSTFLALSASTVADMAGNVVTGVATDSAMQVTQFIADSKNPRLVSFKLNLTNNTLTLTFSEVVAVNSFKPARARLQNSPFDNATASYTLTGGTSDSVNGLTVKVDLTDQDAESIRQIEILAINKASTWLKADDGLLSDPNGLPSAATAANAAINGKFVADTVRPELLSFSFLMANGGSVLPAVLVLTFSETINALQVNLTQITLLAEPTATGNESFVLTDGSVLSNSSDIIRIELSTADVRAIRTLSPDNLLSAQNSTWLLLTENAFVDMASNLVVPGDARKAQAYAADFVRPMLTNFFLDMDLGQLSLTFSEVVYLNSILAPDFTIQNTASITASSNAVRFVFSNLKAMSTDAASNVTLIIGADDLNQLKALPLATTTNNTFLTVATGTTMDLGSNLLLAISAGIALAADSVTPDTTRPAIASFTLDMNSDKIILTFTESIVVSTIDVTTLTIATASGSPSVTLSGGSVVASNTITTVVTINMTQSDSNRLKMHRNLATTVNNTFAQVSRGVLAKDTAGNTLGSQSLFKALKVFPDSTPAQVSSFDLLLNATPALLVLRFNEVIELSTFNVSALYLQKESVASNVSLQITSVSVQGLASETSLTISLDAADTDDLKLSTMCKSKSDCHIFHLAGLIEDVSGNPTQSLNSGLLVDLYVADTVSPSVTAFLNFNLNSGSFSVHFDEPMNLDSFNTTGVVLQSLFEDPVAQYQLTGGIATVSSKNKVVSVIMTTVDLNFIKQDPFICSYRGVCYLRALSGLMADTAANINQNSSIGLLVATFVKDTQKPVLLSYTLDLNAHHLLLTFNEPVMWKSVKPAQFTLRSAVSGGQAYTLTGGIVSQNNSPRILVSLTDMDVQAVKKNSDLATGLQNTFLDFLADSARDMALTANSIDASAGRQVQIYVPDTTAPRLLSFSLDMALQQLRLTFNEPMNFTAGDFSKIQLQPSVNSSSENTEAISLRGGIWLSSTVVGDTLVQFRLLSIDVESLKLRNGLATALNNTYISLHMDAISDMAGVGNTVISNDAAMQVKTFTTDNIEARLLSFSLNLTSHKLALTFDDVMDPISLVSSGLRLQSSTTAVSPMVFALSATSTGTSDFSFTVIVSLSETDALAIKQIAGLAVNRSTTYLTMAAETISDLEGRNVLPITNGRALQATTYTADLVSPSLIRFTLNMSTGVLRLTFDEPVDVRFFNVSKLALQNSADANATLQRFLSNEGVIPSSSGNNKIISFRLEQVGDQAFLRVNRNVATSVNNTFLVVQAGAVTDFAGLPMVAIDAAGAMQASAVHADIVSPQLTSFSIDLDIEVLSLTFSEDMDLSALNFSAMQFQNSATSGNISVMINGTITSDSTLVVEIALDTITLNNLKLNPAFAVSTSTLFLSLESTAGQDMASNTIESIPPTNALQANAFSGDTTGPTLVSFTLNLGTGFIAMTFNEPIKAASVSAEAFTLQNRRNSSATMSLNSSQPSTANGVVILLELSETSLSLLLESTELGNSRSNSFLSFLAGAVQDMAGNNIAALEDLQALQASSYSDSKVITMLEAFTLDVNAGKLTLTFSLAINGTLFIPSKVTLQSHANSGANNAVSYTLTGGAASSGVSREFALFLSDDDLSQIKLRELGVTTADTFLSMPKAALLPDANSTQLAPIPVTVAFQATAVTADSTKPNVLEWSLDLSNSTLTLILDEVVLSSSFNVSGLILVDQPGSTTTVVLSAASSNTSSTNGKKIVVDLGTEDIARIKNSPLVAVNASNSYLAVMPISLTDMAGNAVNATLVSNALAVSVFVPDPIPPDTTRPTVLDFVAFNLGNGTFAIDFSEPVDASTANFSHIALHDSLADFGMPNVFVIGSGTVLSGSRSKVVFQMNSSSLNALKLLNNVCSQRPLCWLQMSSGFIRDLAGNPVQPVFANTTKPKQPTLFVLDTTAPHLESYTLDMNQGRLLLTFSEPVLASTFAPTGKFVLRNTSGTTSSKVTLLTGAGSHSNGVIVTWSLDETDLTALRAVEDLATSTADTFLTMATAVVSDIFDNSNAAILAARALQVTTFVADITRPQLVAFKSYNANTAVLLLSFSEPIALRSFNATKLTLVSQVNGTSRVQLSNSGVAVYAGQSPALKVSIQLTLASVDFQRVRMMFGLAVNATTTFVELEEDTVSDFSGNGLNAQSTAVQVESYTADTTAVALTQFTLDMDSGKLELAFNDAISLSLMQPSGITIQSSQTSALQKVTLIGGSTPEKNGFIVTILLVASDLNALKLNTALATSTSNTFLSMTISTATDVAGNSAVEIASINALQCSILVADQSPPQLLVFSLDLNIQELTLTFNEAVNVASFNHSQITVQDANISSFSVVLSGGIVSSNSQATILTVQLDSKDFNALAVQPLLAVGVSSTFLSVTSGAVADMVGLQMVPVTDEQALQAFSFTPDLTAPKLLAFSVNMDTQRMSLTFSEPVNASSLIFTKILLQNAASTTTVGFDFFTLTSGRVVNASFAVSLQFAFSSQDLTVIQQKLQLFSSQVTSYLAAADGAVTDMHGNPSEVQSKDDALVADTFMQDGTAPTLVDFSLDMNSGILIMIFSEVIKRDTFSASALTVQSTSSSASLSVTLTNSVANHSNGLALVVTLSADDLNAIKMLQQLGVSADSTFVSSTSALIKDMADNSVTAVSADMAIGVSEFTADTTSPQLLSFAVDMDAGTLILNFNEVVNTSSLDVTSATLQAEQADPPSAALTLSGGVTTSANGLQVVIQLSTLDLNTLKADLALFTGLENSYLSLTTSTIADMANVAVQAIAAGAALQAGAFQRDETGPTLERFDLDLNQAELALIFSETVNISSLKTERLMLQTSSAAGTAKQAHLTGGLAVNDVGVGFTIRLTPSDLVLIKLRGIGRNIANTWLTAASGVVLDTSGVDSVARLNGVSALQVNQLQNDTQAPDMTAFVLDMDKGTLALTFSEGMAASTLDVRQLTLVNAGNNSNVQVPFSSGTRVCTVCDGNKFQVSECTQASDTVCAVCKTCASGSYIVAECNATHDTECATCAVCSSGEYTLNECAGRQDTLCATCASSCGVGEYSVAACNSTFDLQCVACSTCGAGYFQATACSNFSDTVCQACTTCDTKQYLLASCTSNSDTICAACQECGADEYEVQACGEWQDRVCSPCRSCLSSQEYETQACNLTNRQCTACKPCAADEFAASACDGASDTVCQTCASGCGSDQYLVAPCLVDSDTQCAACTTSCLVCNGPSQCNQCGSSKYLTVDRSQCVSICPDGSYPSGLGTEGRACIACHASCNTCNGPSDTNCGTCPPSLTINGGKCESLCLDLNQYEDVNGTCQPCDERCDKCVGPSNSECIACANSTLKLHGRQCHDECPVGSFDDGSSVCQSCPTNCFSCTDTTTCTVCTNGYYLVDGNCHFACPQSKYGVGIS